MPIIVVTRLRLRDPSLLDEFFTHAAAVLEQAIKSEGNLGTDALAEAHDAWWSVTAWDDRPHMQAYVNTEPHLSTEALLDHLCDEATFADWEQDTPQLPDWQTSWRHLVADGYSAELTNQSEANQTRAFPAPVEPPASVT
jgi:heme-degrading monooxygenase HmoA